MDIVFTKMHSCGNDYIVLDYLDKSADFSKDISVINRLTPSVVARRFGIGADGVVLIYNDKNADIYIKVLLCGMKEEKLCLNAVLCASKYIYEKGYVFKEEIKVRTDYGILDVTLFASGGKVNSCEIVTPCVDFSAQFASFPKEKGIKHGQIRTIDEVFWFGCVYFGGEYTTVFCEDINYSDIKKGISRLSSNTSFKNGSDIILANVIVPTRIAIRTFKRACGEILSSATSSCVALALATKKGFCKIGEYVLLENTGGNFHIKCNDDYSMSVLGESEFIYEGKYKNNEILV